ncbi:MAG: 3-deoxy-8-phosphooctulonate synthase [Phycisphaerae bacterium]|nr:3-deoxy-8-phosphooctulonate synthase [Phycisphaerae bacterium]
MPATLLIGKQTVGAAQSLFLIAGPCVIESAEICFEIAERLRRLAEELKILVIFKASFDKANRQSISSYRGPGLKDGLAILSEIRKKTALPILSDVHEVHQVGPAGEVLDIIQIPAFLCRQTDLLSAAGASGKCVNIKKGQFMAPEQMKDAVAKVVATGNEKVLLTERGSCFGYGRLINDMSAITVMQEFAPVVFDATHSTQQPGGGQSSSGGRPEFAPLLARAAVAAGADGLFIETHPQPHQAKSDATTMLPLEELENVVSECIAIRKIVTSS